ncbi:MAG TPA: polysaccharide deacetylase family protein [Pirellulaceae bacterium]|nr:polysaccharide deacetylase family protein [Pirellulaceae bacterium]HMO92602.1 polysaccharide deacetylase family protein [Pirellulaceae bacterium]HMP70705.1 polysaccharide deacetylase family protein [Pirellulaceae bacterium]
MIDKNDSTARRTRIASVSLDLDNKWAYLKTHGDEAWESFPSYLDLVVPRILDMLKQFNMTITVFVVGQDAAIEANHASLAKIADAGHEIGNHSFHHEPWLHLYSDQRLHKEFESSERAIRLATGQNPRGFRGPGFSISDGVLRVLAERGYEYDCTIFPTFLGPVARAYYFMKSRLNKGEKEKRKALFGRFRDGFRPLRPFRWNVQGHELIEIPVTTMPIFKLPIHLSYIAYLAGYSRLAALAYFWKSLLLCRLFRLEPSLLLHPLDFMGKEDAPELSFFPGMNLSSNYKLAIVESVLAMLCKHYRVVTMGEHAYLAAQRRLTHRDLALVRPVTLEE